MQRTIEHCSLITRAEQAGIGAPKRYWSINKCDGYNKVEIGIPSDYFETCEECRKCKFCIFAEGKVR